MSELQSERRGAPRAMVDLPFQLSSQSEAQPARLRNISRTGLCCTYASPVTEMTMMGVDLVLPGHEPASIKGVVVRCDKDRDGEAPNYEVAIYFTEIEPAARAAIDEFVIANHGV